MLATFLLLLTLAADAPDPQLAQARAFADSVWTLRDTQQYSQMYRQVLGAGFHRNRTEAQWVSAAFETQARLGVVQSRELIGAEVKNGVYHFRYNAVYDTGETHDDLRVRLEPQPTGVAEWKVTAIGIARVAPPRPEGPLGVVADGRYRNNDSGAEFELPSGWTVLDTQPLSNGADVALLRNSEFKDAAAYAWTVKADTPLADIPLRLKQLIPAKVRQNSYLQGYAIPADSVQLTSIQGRQAIRAVGHYRQNGEDFSELLTWIIGANARVYYSARVRTADVGGLEPGFEQMIQTTVLP